eukprot:TRINITY_DN4085_c0_g1_i1.p1 TRINITY_DN4085_c0_g1~~TRINITY_DN4085_c0_g1_i1.p1  ORF type:complete len:167 (-),score=21.26 TRINITY_DN4085_c0_g1_i1:74-574(-)
MEKKSVDSPPQLCRNNCGFYGNPQLEYCCSKCYKEISGKKLETQTQEAKKTAEENKEQKNQNPKSTNELRGSNEAVSQEVSRLPQSQTEASGPRTRTEVKRQNRCATNGCKRKIGYTSLQCRCGRYFCENHRYPDSHNCSFDFKQFEREALKKDNPLVTVDKIQGL